MAQSYYQAPYMSMYGTPSYMPQTQMQQIPQMPQMPQVSQIPQVQRESKPLGLQGKLVDSIDVVKAMDIPFDGSISFFPLTDGSAIVTKQLQNDGTSKTVVYKPVEISDIKKASYITAEEFEKKIKEIDVKEEIKEIKKQLKNLNNDLRDLSEEVK